MDAADGLRAVRRGVGADGLSRSALAAVGGWRFNFVDYFA